MKVIVIGDPHFQVTNIPEVDMFIEKITSLIEDTKPNFIVVLGDLLHTHEKIHTSALNKAYEFINKINKLAFTYVLVGNHDQISNQVYLTPDHWMNGMKEWKNTMIVDKVIKNDIDGFKFVFLPYVYPGRFREALGTLDEQWEDADCVFAHQEFKGCKMGAIISVEGDVWSIDEPEVISGHIHSNQRPQDNVYYPGSSMEHSFGESQRNVIAIVTFTRGEKKYELEEVDLKLPRKKIVYMNIEDVEDYSIPTETEDKIKVSISGGFEEFKTFKKTKKYKELINDGVKVVFKPKRIEKKIKDENIQDSIEKNKGSNNFKEILQDMIDKNKDVYLRQVYESIINEKEVCLDDIIYI